ncbi:MAG: hypothetical protein ABEN55_06745 [Bradymonadaceae bacterium]
MSILEAARQYLLDERITCSPDEEAQRAASKARTAIVLTRDRLHMLADEIEDTQPNVADDLRDIAGPICSDAEAAEGDHP